MAKKKLTPEQQIVAYMVKMGIQANKVAEVWERSITHVHYVLKGEGEKKRTLTADNLAKFNAHFSTNIK